MLSPPKPQMQTPPVFIQPQQADATKIPKKKPQTPTFLGTGDLPQPGGATLGQKTLLGT